MNQIQRDQWLKRYITPQLRRLFSWWPPRKTVKLRGQRGKYHYECSKCRKLSNRKDSHVDHIQPVVSAETGFITWDEYIDRLFCSEDQLNLLCRDCHAIKTKKENRARQKYKGPSLLKGVGLVKRHKEKIRQGLTGKKKTEAHKAAMSLERKGKKQTAARTAVLARAHQEMERPVIGTRLKDEHKETFKSVSAAARALGIEGPNISRVCRGIQGRTQVSGWHFEYAEEE